MEEDGLERKRRLGRERARRYRDRRAREPTPEREARLAAYAQYYALKRARETTPERKARLAASLRWHRKRTSQESTPEREVRRAANALSQARRKAREATPEREARLAAHAQYYALKRARETTPERMARRAANAGSQRRRKALLAASEIQESSPEREANVLPQYDEKLPRQPRPPSKPLMPFMRYSRKVSRSVWKSVQDKHQNMKIRDFEKIIGEMWEELSEEEKKQYTDEYEADMIKYAEALKWYYDSPVYKTWLTIKETFEADAREAKAKCEADTGAARARFEAEAKTTKAKFQVETRTTKATQCLKPRGTVVEPRATVMRQIVTIVLPSVTLIQSTGGEEDAPPVEPRAIRPKEEEKDVHPPPVKTKLEARDIVPRPIATVILPRVTVVQPTGGEEDAPHVEPIVNQPIKEEEDASPPPLPVKTKLIVIQPTEEEEDLDDCRSVNCVAASGCDHSLNSEISNDAVVPDVSEKISENELQQIGEKHRAKRRKLAENSEHFYEELRNNTEDRKKEEDMSSEVGDQHSESQVSEAFQQARDLLLHLQLQQRINY